MIGVSAVGARSPYARRALLLRFGRLVKSLFTGLLLIGLAAPSVIVLILSFSNDSVVVFPPKTWGTEHFHAIAKTPMWRHSLTLSLELGAAVAVVVTAIGLAFAMGINRTRLPRIPGMQLLILGPIIVPTIALAVALYGLYATLGLIGTRLGIIMAHSLIAFPFVVLIIGAGMTRVSKEVEYASLSLGASRWTTFRKITFPLLGASIATGALFAFISSFDDATFISFLGGPHLTTLPQAIFQSLQFGFDPAITAVATLLSIVTVVLMLVFAFLRRARSGR